MSEFYALVEMEWYQKNTMPPMKSRTAVQLHAATGEEDDAIEVACDYMVEAGRDVPRRETPFSSSIKSRILGAPECPDCADAVAAAE